MEEHYCELRPGGKPCFNVARFRVQDTYLDPGSGVGIWWACAPCFDVCMKLDVWREV